MRTIAEHFMLIYIASESYKTKAHLAQLAEDVSTDYIHYDTDTRAKLKFLDNSELYTTGLELFSSND